MTLQNASLQHQEGQSCRAAVSEHILRLHPRITQTWRATRAGVLQGCLGKGSCKWDRAGKWLFISLGPVLHTQYL